MPPKPKPIAGVDDAEPQARPTHAADLCPCGNDVTLDSSATSFACEHGAWSFPAGPEAEEAAAAARRVAALVELGLTEEQVAALTAPAAPAA